ncbi:S8 family serine peptidase [Candidatus Uhrbacteria bacterium]|nr:S8 family serine peptidase [Candidatus Uhrbacteria bacterium]
MNIRVPLTIAIFTASFVIFTAPAHAVTTLSIGELSVNDTFTITGENFGAGDAATSYACFNDTTHCVRANSFGEHQGWSWSDTSITAQVPTAIAVSGDVLVFVQIKKEECFPEKGFCEIKSVLDERGRAPYKIIPKIFSITPAPSGKKGEAITLKGTGFGDGVGEVYLDSYLATITQWAYGSIDIVTPPQFVGSTKTVSIKSSNGLQSTKPYRVAAGISNDEFSYQQEYLEQVLMPEAWQIAGTQEVTVAVLDDGVLITHPDLEANIWKNTKEIAGNLIDDDLNGFIDDVHGYNFLDTNTVLDPKGFHGTAVAGIIGAVRDNGIGIGGIVKNVKIMPLLVADAKGTTNSGIVDRAIRYAADNGAHVINLSFSTTGENGFFAQLDEAILYAHDKGSVVVAAAGNGDVETGVGLNLNNRPQSPVCNTKRGTSALGAAALDNTDTATNGNKIAKWSNYGSNCVSISAPGTRLVTTVPAQFHKEGKLYALESGTSFAAPIVSGVAGLLKATYPTMRVDEILDRIKATADPIDAYNTTDHQGNLGGRINTYRALALGRPQAALESFQPTSLTTAQKIFITIRNYDPTNRIALTPVSGGVDIVLQPLGSFTGTLDTFEIALPPSLESGTYHLRILSQSQELISTLAQSLEILAQEQIKAEELKKLPVQETPIIEMPISLPDVIVQPPIQTPAKEKEPTNESGDKPSVPVKASIQSSVLPKNLQGLRGRILLQVEGKGEAWYVRPDTHQRVFMGRPRDAFALMRALGVGITTKNLERIRSWNEGTVPLKYDLVFAKKNAGKIFLNIEKKGEAWYIHPKELVRYFLGRPQDAFSVMRNTGLGILNKDLHLIPIEQER